jgi:hypothetical protein
MGEHPHPFVPTRIQTCGGDSGFRLRMCLLRGPRLVGVSVDEAEFQAGMLHHHYPCLAEMARDPDFSDTLMHVFGHILKEQVAEQVKPYRREVYISAIGQSPCYKFRTSGRNSHRDICRYSYAPMSGRASRARFSRSTVGAPSAVPASIAGLPACRW